jgi:RimJ/RimL family protein N-acetyltransferase
VRSYKFLNINSFEQGAFQLVPIRDEDKYIIMQMRNDQIYHLRQREPLTKQAQENYFSTVIAELFTQQTPNQILFSFLHNGECIGYGGLVHINWIDKYAEISFIIKPELEAEYFMVSWQNFLAMLEKIAFEQLKFHKMFTYAFDMRPHLYPAVESCGFYREATLKEHCLFDGKFIDVVIHSKLNKHA